MSARDSSNAERTFAQNVRLISTTDLDGRITYANDAFCEVAGFSREELIGQHHNIVRHQDMPKAAFADLWNHLKADKPWMGLVKNRCKNGQFYWVQAYVMPLFDQHGRKTGYQSVRTLPDRETVDRASSFYLRLNEGKSGERKLLQQLIGSPFTALITALLAFWALSFAPLDTSGRLVGMLLATALVISLTMLRYKAEQQLSDDSRAIYDNPITQQVISPHRDIRAKVKLALTVQSARLRTLFGRVEDSIVVLEDVVASTDQALTRTTEGIEQQNHESDMLATAATEMSATATDVARNTADTAASVQSAAQASHDGLEQLQKLTDIIQQLVDKLGTSSVQAEDLQKQTSKIGSVVEIINEIADKTNLLALNAAIEAARAGEQGRGFAVVADEVRSLAQRTRTATDEIQQSIGNVQTQVQTTVQTMEECQQEGANSISQAHTAGQAIEQVAASLDDISHHSIQISSATEEQSAVAEQLNEHILSIRNIAASNMAAVEDTNKASDELAGLINDLKAVIRNFG